MTELPIEPGFYVADRFPLGTEQNYMPYYLDREGQWWECAEPGTEYSNYRIDTKDVVMHGPFTPLYTNPSTR